MQHLSVLKEEVLNYLDLKEGEKVIDATLGLGGHSLDILEKIGKGGRLYGFDQDERNLREAEQRLADYRENIELIHDNFRYLKTRITGVKDSECIDAILFDLGLSSPHVDEAERGFSFMKEGPLDMRFDQRNDLTAALVLNTYAEADLADIFSKYGEERYSKRLARLICERREEKAFENTVELAEFVEKNVPQKRSSKKSKSHPATQIFQALRIEVNDEFGALYEGMEQAMELLKIGGRIAVITYHSVEDRIVKHFFKALERPEAVGEEAIYSQHADPIVEKLSKKPVIPSESELEANPRSRSAKLRVYKKLKTYSKS